MSTPVLSIGLQGCHSAIRNHMLILASATLGLAYVVLAAPGAQAQVPDEVREYDRVLLRSGGELEGEVNEIEKEGRTYYIVELPDGTQMKLDRSAVKRVVEPRENYHQYVEKLASFDRELTVDDHWRMQEWCRDHRLFRQRTYHLRKVVQLDPDYKNARILLGYRNYDGEWVLEDHFFASQGFVKYQGSWVLPEGIVRKKAREASERRIGEWKQQLRILRSKFMRRNSQEAKQQLLAIQDPAAVPAIIELYDDEDNPTFQRLLIDVLGQIPVAAAHNKLIAIYLRSDNRLNHERALTMLKQDHFDPLKTVKAMYPLLPPAKPGTSRHVVQRAGYIIGELEQPAGIKHLIKGLVTVHLVPNPNAQQGNINTGFGSGGGVQGDSFSFGGGEKKLIKRQFRNDAVLHALERLTGQSFGYDQNRWLEWYINSHSLQDVDLRRDK